MSAIQDAIKVMDEAKKEVLLLRAQRDELLAALKVIVQAWDSPKERAALHYTMLESAKVAIHRVEESK